MPVPNRWLVLAIVSSALFLIVMDMTVLYTALPRLTHDLAASASEKLWIVNAYPLVVAGLLPGFGTLGDRLGHKRLFVAGLAVFGLASLVAAFSPTAAVLIGARALLAVGAAMMMPATLSIIRLTFEDEHERAFAIGVWAAIASGGAAVGPLVGGLLLEYFWWGSVFLINVPVVLVAIAVAVPLIPFRPGNAARKWDAVGSAQILVGLVALAYAVKEAATTAPAWGAVALAALVGVGALWVFKRRQNRLTDKLIDFTLFADPRFASGVATAVVASLALIGIQLVISQRLQLVLEMAPLEAGLFILPIPVAAFLAGPLAGLIVPRVGGVNVLWSSTLVAALGLLLYLAVHNGPVPLQMAGFTLLGIGVGGAMTAASTVIMLGAPPDRAGMAASIEEVSYELGGAIGIAILGSVLSVAYALSLTLPEGLAVPAIVFDSLDEALLVAEGLAAPAAEALRQEARAAFETAFVAATTVAIAVMLATSLAVHHAARRSRATAPQGSG